MYFLLCVIVEFSAVTTLHFTQQVPSHLLPPHAPAALITALLLPFLLITFEFSLAAMCVKGV